LATLNGAEQGPADDLVELQGPGVGRPVGVPAGRAGVRGGGPVGVQHGVAPAGTGVPARRGDQVPGGLGVQQAEPAGLAGGAGGALPGSPRDGEGDLGGQARAAGPRWPAGAAGAVAGTAAGAAVPARAIALAGATGVAR